MPRLILDPEEGPPTTRELYDEDIADERLRFDEAGRTDDLDEDVVAAYDEADVPVRRYEAADEDEVDPVADLLSGTVDEVRDRVEDGEFDDRLGDVLDTEARNDDRVGVREAVERRQRGTTEPDERAAEEAAEESEAADEEPEPEPDEPRFGVNVTEEDEGQ